MNQHEGGLAFSEEEMEDIRWETLFALLQSWAD